MITPEQAGYIAGLIRTIRPAWDQLVIMNTLRGLARFDLADLTHAAIRTASDETMRTPAALAWTDSEHWRPTVKWTETPAEREQRKTAQVAEREQSYRDRATLPDPSTYLDRIRAEIRPCKAPNLRPTEEKP